MHTFGDTAAGVPAFLAKLWRLVDDPDTNDLICWSKDGRSFIIQNQAKFARELLPMNYKHNNMASFIRQLNMYGFHKITSIDTGGLKFDRDEMEFSHPYFKRNHPYLLENIKRKIATSKATDEKAALKPETVSKVLQDVRAMRGRQESLDSRFSVMKQENEALWREIASLRQKHAKQQQIVNKLIQFLITIVQPARNIKRHMQLMINDAPENSKIRKTSESETDLNHRGRGGPVIHDITEELLDEVADSVGVMYNDECSSPSPLPIERPHSSISLGSQNYDYSNQSAEDLFGTNPSTPGTPVGAGRGPSEIPGSPAGQAIIQSVNPDGSQVVYHVTEIPDAHPRDSPLTVQPNFSEDNILHTPMVREQLLKQKNRRRKTSLLQGSSSSMSSSSSSPPSGNFVKMSGVPQQQQQQQQGPVLVQHRPIQIKTEDDPMQFLNVYIDNNSVASPATPSQQQQLISPNLSEDSRQSLISNGRGATPTPNNVIVGNANATLPVINCPNPNVISPGAAGSNGLAASTTTTTNSQSGSLNNAMGLYSADFIENDIPNDIFEDSILDNPEETNSSLVGDLQPELSALQSTINNGKFSSFPIGANDNTNGNGTPASVSTSNGASTSTASVAGVGGGASAAFAAPSTSSSALGKTPKETDNENNMTVAKYNKKNNNTRLSTFEEVTYHLDSLQDELDTLKDLLRNDNYSVDNNLLLSLFNDSDILGPYGLSINPDGQNEKKGNELITYQPTYDLSDIMSINNDTNLEADADVPSPSGSGLPQSVLNTPYHQ